MVVLSFMGGEVLMLKKIGSFGALLKSKCHCLLICSVMLVGGQYASAGSVIGAEQFQNLAVALTHYQQLAKSGQWVSLSSKAPETIDDEVWERALLTNLLTLSGDLPAVQKRVALVDVSDIDLQSALMRFQQRHGLDADGYLGRDTRRLLNVSPYRKAEILAANLMRLQDLPMWPGTRYLVVNVGGFRLDLIESNRSVLSMKVIAGRGSRPTPIHSDRIQQVVVNPPWNVPRKLQRLDVLPKLRDNPDYLRDNNYVLVQYLPEGRRVVDVEEAGLEGKEWTSDEIDRFPYQLRQQPGSQSALGRYKFDFPNRHAVYLHDTPTKKLFNRPLRAFSSGCVRVEKPRQLAEALLSLNPGWHPADLDQWLAQGRTRYVSLRQQLPVHLVYQTAWVNDLGSVQFRPDVYGRDRAPQNFSLHWQPEARLLSQRLALTPQG